MGKAECIKLGTEVAPGRGQKSGKSAAADPNCLPNLWQICCTIRAVQPGSSCAEERNMKVRTLGLGLVLAGFTLASVPAMAQDPKSGGGAPGGGASERSGGGGAAAS